MDANEVAELAKAISNPIRITFLQSLRQEKALSPSEFARTADLPIPNVSYHIKALEETGIVTMAETVPKRGALERRYTLREPRALLALELIDRLTRA